MFKIARNKYVNKLNYVCRMDAMKSIRKRKGDQKDMWRILKSLINKKCASKPSYIEFENVETTKENESHIANRFNEFFINSVKDIHQRIENGVHSFDLDSVSL